MLRPNLLRSYNSKIKNKGPLDDFIDGFGGTLFQNCYTPAPDTPRSLGCLHSGLYPNKNGCDTRIRWPYYFYKESHSLLESLVEKGFDVTYYATKNKINVGPLPKDAKEKVNILNCLSKFDKTVNEDLKNDEDSAYFLTLDDYHWANDDYGHNSLGDYYGQLHLKNYLESFFKNNNQDMFDHIFWFSDHGHKLYSELKNIDKNSLLNDDRTQIHLLARKKNEMQLSYDNKLRGIFDIYPTILSIINAPVDAELDGRDLYSKDGHDFIVFEDHNDFSVSLSQVIDNWGVRTRDECYFESLDSKTLFKISGVGDYQKKTKIDNGLYYANMIREHSVSYDVTKKQNSALNYYKELRHENEDLKFSDNKKRFFKNRNIVFKIIRYMLKDSKKRW